MSEVATKIRKENGKTITRYHQADVVIVHPDGGVELNRGKYKTVTTKKKMNEYSPSWLMIYQKDHMWYVNVDLGKNHGGITHIFFNGSIYYENGTVNHNV